MVANIIEFKAVSYGFGRDWAVKDLSFTVKQGGTAVLIGASGAGKTTILKLIAGLLTPNSGTVLIDGRNLVLLSAAERQHYRRNLGYLFQQGALISDLTVFANIALPLQAHGQAATAATDLVTGQLAAVGLTAARDKYPGELSGGMLKRAALARALILKPRLILYDEPFTGLDPINLNNIRQLMQQHRQSGATAVMVTHDLRESLPLATQIIFLDNGQILFSGTPGAFLDSPLPAIKNFVRAAAVPGSNAKADKDAN